jgi:PadR family transcriptional regulator AphA
LSPNDWAVLGIVAEKPTHGYPVALLLGEGGPVGQVWTLQRSEVYASIRKLIGSELISEGPPERVRPSPARRSLTVTPAGKRLVRRWLSEPVDHIRDVRSLLLLKLVLLDRSHRDSSALIEAQKAKLTPVVDGLEASVDGESGFDRVVAVWRVTSCRATMNFLARLQSEAHPRIDNSRPLPLRTARRLNGRGKTRGG